MKAFIELSEEELERLIDYLIIYRNSVLKIASAEAYHQVSMLIDKLQKRVYEPKFCPVF